MTKIINSDWKIHDFEDVSRFLKAQQRMYETALEEVRNGRKESHWMWYVFPQLRGLGRTYNANYYGIADLEEARRYLEEPTLKAHMDEILDVLLALPTDDPESIFGGLDAMKLRSSMTLFDLVSPNDRSARVLEKFFDGRRDQRTLEMI